ncbi:rhomboid family intramembrane serine protease [Candidatus Bathycorpusculum sp.]|jgi:rhomboid protease GluP|uniref:rhomboid family intramembrane serine protease n=1 Tax=Candidatus Bathycorpusculum sp. TaxID=2994959 RepID=UPI00282B6A15|nr:rhomboid family intramembrane serine protease [Candidatus Termitimicrobium sp.]MCL2432057.1 rhomboid family intramembrane serine protease [Candidatus Termitimicrobium sp.]MDR0471572.1 rhomboid family intramembrane serine protease [Nitrososphaerota archaeon]
MNCEKYKPTYILIGLNVAIYIIGAIIGGNALQTPDSVVVVWGQVNKLVFEGFYWQLFTSMFIHASIFHLVGNMVFLFIFGLRGEEMFSLSEYLGIYLLGGLAGNILSLAFGVAPGGMLFISVGASGAIFALFGACIIYDRHAVRQSILGALVFAFFLFFINTGEGVNVLAHFGGLVFGLIGGYMIASRRKPEQHVSREFRYRNTPF